MRTDTLNPGRFLLMMFMLLVLPLSSFAGEQELHDTLYEASKALANGDFSTGMGMLDQLVERNPEYIQGRKFRAGQNWAMGRGEIALEDFERILTITPDDTNIMLQRCMVFESMGRSMEVLKPCYENVVKKMQQKYPISLLAGDQDYVFAVMLAELPEAEDVKRTYIEQIPSKYSWEHSTLDENAQKQLIKQEQDGVRNFDRSTIKKIYEQQREKVKHVLGLQ